MTKNITIGIVKLGNSNLSGIRKLLVDLDKEVKLVEEKAKLNSFSHIIIPGVGSFDYGIQALERLNLAEEIIEFSISGKPLLGICLGMQLLGAESDEGVKKGLNLYPAKFKKLTSPNLILPHVGFNKVNKISDIPILKDLESPQFYFNHTYACTKRDLDTLRYATTDYGEKFLSIISHENITGVQFHPEKSYFSGIKLFENFVRL